MRAAPPRPRARRYRIRVRRPRSRQSAITSTTLASGGTSRALSRTRSEPSANRSRALAAREFGLSPRREDARLLDPMLALYAALEVEDAADALDVGAGPVGHLLVLSDAERVELLLDQHADAANALQIVDAPAVA